MDFAPRNHDQIELGSYETFSTEFGFKVCWIIELNVSTNKMKRHKEIRTVHYVELRLTSLNPFAFKTEGLVNIY